MTDRDRPPAALLVANFAVSTGFAWRFIYRLFGVLAVALQERGFGVFVSFAQVDSVENVIAPVQPQGVFEFDPLALTLGGVLRLCRHVVRRRIRYVYFSDMPTWHWLYAILRLVGVRAIVVHVHASVQAPQLSPETSALRRAIKRMLNRRPLGADACYAVSRFVEQRLVSQACYPHERVVLLYNGIDVASWSCRGAAASTPLRVFMASRATTYKGVQVLVEATRLLLSIADLPPFVVEFAGIGPDLERFKTQVRDLRLQDVFRFLGHLGPEDTRDKVWGADVVVVPSVWGEAFSLACLEGMAAGKAVVGSRVGGIPELLDDGNVGVLVDANDPAALANALASLLRDGALRSALGSAARDRAQSTFSEASLHRQLAARFLHDCRLQRLVDQ